MVLCLIARRLDDDDDDDDVDDVSSGMSSRHDIFVPVKNTDARVAGLAQNSSRRVSVSLNGTRATGAKNTTMSVKSFDESEASEKRVKSKRLFLPFFIRRRI